MSIGATCCDNQEMCPRCDARYCGPVCSQCQRPTNEIVPTRWSRFKAWFIKSLEGPGPHDWSGSHGT